MIKALVYSQKMEFSRVGCFYGMCQQIIGSRTQEDVIGLFKCPSNQNKPPLEEVSLVTIVWSRTRADWKGTTG